MPVIGGDGHEGSMPSIGAPGDGHLGVAGLSKRYGATVALDDVSLEVEAGRFLVLLGPSGSGKTTFLRGLAGIESLDAGTIHLGGQLVADGRRGLAPERRDLAMVFQDYALWRNLTVRKNLEYALVRRRPSRSEAKRICAEALERVGLLAHANRYPSQLSGGEQQRVALARALVARPKLLLFDEPLSHLDADLRERLRIEISTIARESGATCVYITHDQREAFALADKIGVLRQGRLLQIGLPEEIHARPATPFVAAFSGIAGALPVELVAAVSPGEKVSFRAGGSGAELVGRWCDDVASRSRHATAMIRPSSVQIGDPGPDRLPAMVLDAAYRGDGYDHVIALADGSNLIGVPAGRRWERNENVGLTFNPEGCLLYAREGDEEVFDIWDPEVVGAKSR